MLRLFNRSTHQTRLSDTLRNTAIFQATPGQDMSFKYDSDKEKIRQLIGKAFAGNNDKGGGEPYLEWSISHLKFPTQEEREQFSRVVMSYAFFEDINSNAMTQKLQNKS